MLTKRPANERGHANHGWLDTYHSFSFARYYDPDHMGFRTLRVLNDDVVDPGAGFGTHPHDNMEILTYVLEGALEHKDSMGSGSVLRPGDVQRMSAGTGVTHSEFNHSKEEPLRLLQIWVLPEEQGLKPGYEEKHFPETERRGVLRPIATRDARDGSLRIYQDVAFYASILGPGDAVSHALGEGRGAWVQVATGTVKVNGETLTRGDGAAITDETEIRIEGVEEAELLLIDLA